MVISQPYDILPPWAVYLVTALILIVSAQLGFAEGKFLLKRWPDKSESGVGVMVGAALALLGFLLAFVTGEAIGLFGERRELVIAEANAIGTTYLRAGYLPQTASVESRQLLAEYVDQRLEALDRSKTALSIARSEEIHNELWAYAEDLAREDPTPITALYVSSLNELIDLHTERIGAELSYRIPMTVLLGLYGVAILSMTLVGIHSSYQEKRNLISQVIVVLILSLVFLLILDLDRSHRGLIQIPQDAMLALQESFRSSP